MSWLSALHREGVKAGRAFISKVVAHITRPAAVGRGRYILGVK